MLASLALGLSILLMPAPPTPEEVRAASEKVFQQDGWQKDLPEQAGEADAPARPRIPRRRPGEEAPAPRDEPVSYARESGWGSAVAEALLWLMVGVAAVLLFLWIARKFSDKGKAFVAPPAASLKHDPARPVPAAAYEDAEAAAAEGRYAEAIHILLLRTLAALAAASSGGALAPSLTSREILARATLKAPAREALAGLVGAVEVSWFGGRVLEAEEWAACRERFRRLVAAPSAEAA